MSREKQGHRETMAELNEMFPDQGMLGRIEIAKFMGVHVTTVDRWIRSGKLKVNPTFRMVPKADLARQICI